MKPELPPGEVVCSETSGPGSRVKLWLALPGVGLLVIIQSAQLLSVSVPSGRRMSLRPAPLATTGEGAKQPAWPAPDRP